MAKTRALITGASAGLGREFDCLTDSHEFGKLVFLALCIKL